MRFEGKSAIVTGAASGIGRAVAVRLAEEGARVVIGDRNMDGLAETATAIGAAATSLPLDVTDAASCRDFVAKALAANGGLDVLCNIAGTLDFGRLDELTDERWMRVIAVNLHGVFFLSQAALPHLVKTRGAIVNMASTAGLIGIPFNAAYTASKHGVVGLTKSLAIEFSKEGVRVNAVCPGGVETPLIARTYPENLDWELMRTSSFLNSGELAQPEDIADAVAFLASQDAKRVTGVAFPVDGGQTAI
jgi:Dehydrogenases with different specificities (related to short-chain alcohol dehydrogenases)